MRHSLEQLEARMLLATLALDPVRLLGYEVEPNDTIETATPLQEFRLGMPCMLDSPSGEFRCPPAVFQGGGTLGGSTAPTAADVDHFSFSLEDASIVSMRVYGPAVREGAVFELVAGDGTVLGTAQSHQANTLSVPAAGIEVRVPAAGTYYVRSTALTELPAEGLRYEIGVSTRIDRLGELEPNDSFDSAQEVKLETRRLELPLPALVSVPRVVVASGFVTAALGNSTQVSPDVDFYQFTTETGDMVSVRVSGDSLEGVRLRVFDRDHNLIAETTVESLDPNGLHRPGPLELRFEAMNAGPYFAQVDDSTPSDTLQRYRLDVRELHILPDPLAEQEPNNNIETANPLTEVSRLLPPIRIALSSLPANVAEPASTPDDSLLAESAGLLDPVCVDCAVGPVPARVYVAHGNFAGGTATDPDQDYYSFTSDANSKIAVRLMARVSASVTLLDKNGMPLVSSDDTAARAGRMLEYSTADGGTFYLLVEPAGLTTPELSQYGIQVLVRREEPAQHNRLHEQEPNDTFEQANDLELHVLPTFAPGIELRGGEVRGIAAGQTNDQDTFKFLIHAGEHVTVDVQGIRFDGLTPRPIEVWRDAATNAASKNAPSTPLPEPIHPLNNLTVTVYDSAGNPVGSSSSDDHGVVSFDASADDSYYAVVSASTPQDTAQHYRLGVLARSSFNPDKVDPDDLTDPDGDGTPGSDGADPAELVLENGRSFTFTDADGDLVTISFRGRGGLARIRFTDSEYDGSDIAEIQVDGVRKGGRLIVETDGSAEIGAIEIHGPADLRSSRRRTPRKAGFDTIQVDGNVGMLASDLNVRTLSIDGVLGGLAAQGRQIRQLRVETFDTALADVGSILEIEVREEPVETLFQSVLPWKDAADQNPLA